MASWKTPTEPQIKRVAELLSHPTRLAHFFNQLENPLWLRPLWEKGFFRNPPAPVRDEAQGTVRYPPWPEARYLTRMATHDPATVSEIIAAIPDNGNVWLYEELTNVALAMPVEHAAWIADRAPAWLEPQHHFLLPRKLGELMGSFARDGRVDESLSLARTLLRLLPEYPKTAGRAIGSDVEAKVDRHAYGEIVRKYIPDVIAAAPGQSLRLFSDSLAEAIAHTNDKETTDSGEDASYVWCPSVEECAPDDRAADARMALVACIRDAAHRCATNEPTSVARIIEAYDSKKWQIFERLGYHLLRSFPEAAMDLVDQRLTDRSRFDVFETRYEYERLQERCFNRLGSSKQNRILNWIEEGPDLEAYAAASERWHGKRPDAGELEKYAERWRRDRLAPIHDALPLPWRSRYDKLVHEFGETPSGPFRAVGSVRWVGRTSPINAEQLKQKSNTEIVAFLATWRETDSFNGPSYEGLINEVKQVVSGDPARFVAAWHEFTSLPRRYIYALLDGLTEATRKQWEPSYWGNAIAICEWVLKHPEALKPDPNEDEVETGDPSWSWLDQVILGLLDRGLEEGPAPIPYELRGAVWSVLESLSTHPNPSPEKEEWHIEHSNADFVTLSINSVRGKALHGVVRYALWLRRHFDAVPESHPRAEGFTAMPEVALLLERHLDTTHDPSLTIRSVFGQWFPWLCLLDTGWAESHREAVFPGGEDDEARWEAAWVSYILYCRPYNNVVEILRPVYTRAVERLADARDEQNHRNDPSEKLAEHLMICYGRGIFLLRERVVQRFFEIAPATVRSHAMHFVGWSLNREEKDVPNEVLKRFQELWESRLSACRNMPHGECERELRAFGWWYAAHCFPLGWALKQLFETLKLCPRVEADAMVLEKLAEDVDSDPDTVMRCVELLAGGDTEGWAISGGRDHLCTIFSKVLRANELALVTRVRTVINRLTERGFLEFGRLVDAIEVRP